MALSVTERIRRIDQLVDKAQKPPSGWRTCREWGVLCGLNRRAMSDRIHELLTHGHAEVRSFALRTPGGKLRGVPHYRIPALEE